MSKELVGLEIDGDTVTLVEVKDGYAQFVRVLSTDSLSNSIKLALAGYKLNKNEKAVRVVFSCPGTNFRVIDVTATLKDRKNFEDAVFTAMPVSRESNATSGIFFTPDEMVGNMVSKGIAMIAPALQVEEAYQALGKIKSELVSPPAVFTGLDGIWLSVKNQTTDVTLVDQGRPVAYRQLRTGGLDILANKVGDTITGREKVYSALNRNAKVDPILENEIRLYSQNLAIELRQTVDYWARSNENVTSKINLIGVGANLLGISEALFDQNFTIELNDTISKRVTQIPVEDRARAISAFLATMTAGDDMPYVSYVNPYSLAIAEEKKRRDKRAKQYILGMITIGAVALATILPFIFENSKLKELEKNIKQSQSEFTSLSESFDIYLDIERKKALYKELKCDQPDWKETLAIVFTAIEEVRADSGKNVTVNEVKTGISDDSLKITFTSELVNGDSDDLTTMLRKLREITGVESAWSDSFTYRDGKANYSISFSYKESLLEGSTVTNNNSADELCLTEGVK